MAVEIKGKLRGRIGNVVYRVVNGKQFAQSLPSRKRKKRKATMHNRHFAKASTFGSCVYGPIKRFGLNAVDYSFYHKLVSIGKKQIFNEHALLEHEKYHDWNLIPDTDYLEINPKSDVNRYFGVLPNLIVDNNEIVVQVEAIKFGNYKKLALKDANNFQICISLVHYTFDEVYAGTYLYKSDVFTTFKGSDGIEFRIDLDTLEPPVKNMLIIVCYGLFFSPTNEIPHYLNTKDFNPIGVLGMYYKKQE